MSPGSVGAGDFPQQNQEALQESLGSVLDGDCFLPEVDGGCRHRPQSASLRPPPLAAAWLRMVTHRFRVSSERLHESVGVPGWYLEPRGLHSGGVSLSPLSPGLGYPGRESTAEHDVRQDRHFLLHSVRDPARLARREVGGGQRKMGRGGESFVLLCWHPGWTELVWSGQSAGTN